MRAPAAQKLLIPAAAGLDIGHGGQRLRAHRRQARAEWAN
jgi:hypothetical protein